MKYKSNVAEAIHSTIADLYEVGVVNKEIMERYDEHCLEPIKTLTPAEIRQLREREQVSQTTLAHYLNVSRKLVADWENGIKKPTGAALKLLTIVQNKGTAAIA